MIEGASDKSGSVFAKDAVVTMAPLMPSQRDLFPIRTLIEIEENNHSADIWGRVIAEDGHPYIVKAAKGGASVRANEWIATHLAEAVHLACPTAKIVEMANGELLFGSREIAGVADKTVTTEILTSSAAAVPDGSSAKSILSAIYALDMYIFNIDRHQDNYLSVVQGGARRFYLIDFSRSLLWQNLPPGFPERHHQTRRVGALIQRRHGFDLDAALNILDRIAALSDSLSAEILNRMPESWITIVQRRMFEEWWSSGNRRARIARLREGMKDGSLL